MENFDIQNPHVLGCCASEISMIICLLQTDKDRLLRDVEEGDSVQDLCIIFFIITKFKPSMIENRADWVVVHIDRMPCDTPQKSFMSIVRVALRRHTEISSIVILTRQTSDLGPR